MVADLLLDLSHSITDLVYSWTPISAQCQVLPLEGSKEIFDAKAGATYSYDEKKRILVSYDNPESAKMKTEWIKEKGMRGAMFWEASGDAKSDDRSLISNVAKEVSVVGCHQR